MKKYNSVITPSNIPICEKNIKCIEKRVLDYLLGIPLFILLFPLMVVLAIVIKTLSPGPIFFIQNREGIGRRNIRVIKFRTMYINAEERLEKFLSKNPEKAKEWYQFFKLDPKIDPRLIPLGAFLRKSSLDELPNLWNVLRGDMSLVGPRPFPYYHLDTYDLEFRNLRASVWPGITGLWQLRRGDAELQRKYDMEYINNWSFLLDIKIIIQTIPIVLLAKKNHY